MKSVVGQGEILSVVILVGVVLVIGTALTALVVPQVMRISEENNLKSLLHTEQSNLVLYREYENSTHIFLGVLRVEPGNTRYAIAILSQDLSIDAIQSAQPNIQRLVSFPQSSSSMTTYSVRRSNVFYIFGGDYYPLPSPPRQDYINVVYVPEDIVKNYVSQGRPFVVAVNKAVLNALGVEKARIIFLVQVSDKFYEVGEWAL
ncbi:MAG: hypothetical protein QW141_00225 [Ignisphaera sp.]